MPPSTPPATGSEANSVSFDPAAILVPEDRGPGHGPGRVCHGPRAVAQVHVLPAPERRRVPAAPAHDTVVADVPSAGNGTTAGRDNGGGHRAGRFASRGNSSDGARAAARGWDAMGRDSPVRPTSDCRRISTLKTPLTSHGKEQTFCVCFSHDLLIV